ncbi:MAG: hypothetical protein KDC38_15915 [Planctomycetes bacterium]|nr:hypothetical protein [Planctomycetota bacterium]
MFWNDPTLYQANFPFRELPFREFPYQSTFVPPYQQYNLPYQLPIQNVTPFLGAVPPWALAQQFPQVPFTPFFNAPMFQQPYMIPPVAFKQPFPFFRPMM